jgi:HPt (histidine-containing phosphotransfer) domain-containing protein
MSEVTPVMDPAAVVRLQRLGGDKLVRQMIRLYLENAGERLGQIDAGLPHGADLDETRRGAHSLKSSAANVGALRVSGLAAELEVVSRAGDRAAARGLRNELADALEEARIRLENVTRGLA